MPIYCSIDPYSIVEFASEPLWHPRDVDLCIPKRSVSRGVYRWIDPQGVYLGWMAIRIERAFSKLATGHPVDLERLSLAIETFYEAREAVGVAPCGPEAIPAGYGPPSVPACVEGATSAFTRDERNTTEPHLPGAGWVQGGAGVATVAGGGGGAGCAAGAGRTRAPDGGRAWQLELDRWAGQPAGRT